jgi:multidrug efflux pump subunit AcrB
MWTAAFARLTAGYDRAVQRIVRRSAMAVVVLLVLGGASYSLVRSVPTGFAPTEDQGYLLVNVQLPDAASLERTDAVVRQIEQILLETPGVETVVAIGGRSFISGVNGPNVASLPGWRLVAARSPFASRAILQPARGSPHQEASSWCSRRLRSAASVPAAGSSSSCRAWPAARSRTSTPPPGRS